MEKNILYSCQENPSRWSLNSEYLFPKYKSANILKETLLKLITHQTQMDLWDYYDIFLPKHKRMYFLSAPHGTLSKIDTHLVINKISIDTKKFE